MHCILILAQARKEAVSPLIGFAAAAAAPTFFSYSYAQRCTGGTGEGGRGRRPLRKNGGGGEDKRIIEDEDYTRRTEEGGQTRRAKNRSSEWESNFE